MRDYKRTRVKNQRQKKGKAGRKKKNIFSLRNRTFIYAIMIFIFVSVSVFYIWKYVPRSLFDIEFSKAKIVSVNGNRNLSEEEIKKLSEVEGKNFLTLSLEESAIRLVKNSWIRGVDVRRKFPNKISIAVDERLPFARVKLNNLNLIDEEGVILSINGETAKKELPLISGVNENIPLKEGDKISSPNLKAGIETLKEIQSKQLFPISDVSVVNVNDPFNPVLTVKNYPGQIYLGVGNLDEKIKNLRAFSSNKKEVFPLVSYIDLRFKNRVIVMPIKQADRNKGSTL